MFSHTKSFKLATYNIQASSYPKDIINTINYLKRIDVNMITLQEVCKIPNQIFIGEKLKKILGKNWKFIYFYGTENTSEKRGDGGLCIAYNASLFKKITSENIYLPKLKKLQFLDRMINLFLGYSGNPSQRKAISAIFKFRNNQFRVTTLHLDWHSGKKQRMKQLTFLLNKLSSLQKTSYEIICGDFNTSELFKKRNSSKYLSTILGNKFLEASANIPWTLDLNNISLPKKQNSFFNKILKRFNIHYYQKLDYIWIKNFKLKNIERPILPGSDHFH